MIFNNTSYKHNESTAVTSSSSPGKGFRKLNEMKKFKTVDYQEKVKKVANDKPKIIAQAIGPKNTMLSPPR